MNFINRYKKIIILVTVFVVLLAGFIFYFALNKKTVIPSGNINNDESSYYVAAGLEKIENVTKLAVENYATQDIKETRESRVVRLKQYFTSESPAYDYELDNIYGPTYKTTAKVITIYPWESGENDFSVIVDVSVKLYSDGGNYVIEKSYWVPLLKVSENTYLASDIEEFKE